MPMPHDTKIIDGADQTIKLDLAAMNFVQSRLDLADFGRMSVQIVRAAQAKRPSELQRLLLSIVRHKEPVND